jgi:radical SAM protein with 4Fe4S-binding SPASM domain
MTDPYFILELTTQCNLNCIYCYNVWKEQSVYDTKKLNFSSVKKIIPEILKSYSISGITLAGGEPMLNEEVFGIAAYLTSCGIKVSITSNGILMTNENVRQLIKCGIRHFEISLPAVDPENFSALCASKDVKAVRNAMLKIKEQNAKLSVASVVTKLNYKKITEVIELSAAFGADSFVFNRFVPGGEGRKNAELLALDPSELFHSLSLADKAAASCRIPVIVAIPVEHCLHATASFKNLHWGSCGCGKAKWVIDPEGNLRCCEQNPDILGNLLEEGFQELIQKAEVKTFCNNNLQKNCIEKNCFSVCGGGCRYLR